MSKNGLYKTGLGILVTHGRLHFGFLTLEYLLHDGLRAVTHL